MREEVLPGYKHRLTTRYRLEGRKILIELLAGIAPVSPEGMSNSPRSTT